MYPGIFAKTFPRPSVEEVFDAMRVHGLEHTQFNLSCVGLPSMPEEIDPGVAYRVREAAAERGVIISVVSGTFNMIHPDEEERRAGLRRLEVLAASCDGLGTSTITLCTGTRDSENMWRHHPANDAPEAWSDLLSSMQLALNAAEEHGVTLAFEPEPGNVVSSAARGRRLLDEMDSPRLKVIVDAANLLQAEGPARAEDTLGEAFELLGEDLVIAHAKDLAASGEIVAAGRGVVDYDLYLRLLRQAGFEGPIILHGLDETEVDECVAFLRDRLADGGGR